MAVSQNFSHLVIGRAFRALGTCTYHPVAGAGGRGGGAIQTYLTVLLVDRFGMSVSPAALFFAAYTFVAMFGPLAMGWFSDRTSLLLATRLNLIFSSLCIVSILAPAVPGIPLAVFIFLSGFFIGSRNALLQTLLLRCGTQGVRIDTQLSLYFTIGAISGSFWTILVGVLVDQFGMATAIWTMAISYLVAMIILSFIRLDQSSDKHKPAPGI